MAGSTTRPADPTPTSSNEAGGAEPRTKGTGVGLPDTQPEGASGRPTRVPSSQPSDQPEPADRVALLLQLHHAAIDSLARELRHVEALDDAPLAVPAGAGHATDDPLADPI